MKHLTLLFIVIAGISWIHLKHPKEKTRKISGQVLSGEERAPLEGVLIIAKGSTRVSGTHPDGFYYIEIPEGDTTLDFEKEGYQGTRIRLGALQEYNVTLQLK